MEQKKHKPSTEKQTQEELWQRTKFYETKSCKYLPNPNLLPFFKGRGFLSERLKLYIEHNDEK